MSIAFVTGGLEPGCDGVGDYSRELAAELIRQGHGACLISLADRVVTDVSTEQQYTGGVPVRALRIPIAVPWARRVELAREFMEAADVSGISFQFVPYSYSPKGVIRTAVPFLVQLAEGRKVHMMFHELWIGNYTNSPFKERLVGALQKYYILQLIRRLRPAAIHATNPVYAAFLERDGFRAGVLPLFGNIPVSPDSGTEQAFELFRNAGTDLSNPSRGAYWVGGIFGSILTEWKAEPFFGEVAALAAQAGKTVVIAGIGRFGRKGETIWSELVRTYSDQFRFSLLGPLPAGEVSHVLRVLDFGISMSPWCLLGKSSTVASMTDHGIPTIVTRNDWFPRPSLRVELNYTPLLRRYDAGTMKDFLGFLAAKCEPASTRFQVSQRFIEAFSGS